MKGIRSFLISALRWSERYTKTDMLYLAGSSFWLNLSFIITSAFAFLLSIAFANLIPKAEFGIYQYLLALASILSAFTFSGMNSAITHAVAKGHDGILKSSIRLQLLWNLFPAFIALGVGGYYFIQGNTLLGIGAVIIGITLPLTTTFNSYTAFLSGKKSFKTLAQYTIFGNLFYYAAIFAAVFFIPTAIWLVFINLAVNAAIAVFFYIRTSRTITPASASDPEAVPYARHLTAMNFLSIIAAHIDKMLVFKFLGAPSLAAYALATLLPDKLVGAFKPLLIAAFPRFAARNFNEIREHIALKMSLIVLGTSIAAGLYAYAAPFLLNIIYPSYLEIIPYSQLYAFTFIATAGHLGVGALTAHKKVKDLYILNTIMPLAQISLLLVGILTLGLLGLVIGRVVSAVLFGVIALVLIYRNRN